MDERQIEQLAKGLGATAAAKLDVEQTARAVLRRVKEKPVAVKWWRRMPVLQSAAAAAVVLLAAGVLVIGQLANSGDEVAVLPAFTELHALSDDELVQVYDSLTADAPVYELSAANLQDLNEGQLEELLARMEG